MSAISAMEKDPDTKKWFDDNFGAKVQAVMEPAFTDLMDCKDDKGVEEALRMFAAE
jgi:hypothetical protein